VEEVRRQLTGEDWKFFGDCTVRLSRSEIFTSGNSNGRELLADAEDDKGGDRS